MSSRTRTTIVAGALGLAVLAPISGAFAQSPPRDPNPPARSGEPGPCPHGYDDQGRWHHGDNGMHGGYYDDQGRWHHGDNGDRAGGHHGMR